MIIVLPAEAYRLLFRNCRSGTPEYKALRKAKSAATSVPLDKLVVVCDTETAERLLRLAGAWCPEAAPIIQEGIKLRSNSE